MKAKPQVSKDIKKAISQEVNRQIAGNVDKLSKNMTALVLWSLHTHLGFGKKRLLRFYQHFLPAIREMQNYYEMHDADSSEYLCAEKLKTELDIDVYELDKMIPIGFALKGDKEQRS